MFVPLEIIRVATLAPYVLQCINEETPAEEVSNDDDEEGDMVFISAYLCFFCRMLLTGACR